MGYCKVVRWAVTLLTRQGCKFESSACGSYGLFNNRSASQIDPLVYNRAVILKEICADLLISHLRSTGALASCKIPAPSDRRLVVIALNTDLTALEALSVKHVLFTCCLVYLPICSLVFQGPTHQHCANVRFLHCP